MGAATVAVTDATFDAHRMAPIVDTPGAQVVATCATDGVIA